MVKFQICRKSGNKNVASLVCFCYFKINIGTSSDNTWTAVYMLKNNSLFYLLI